MSISDGLDELNSLWMNMKIHRKRNVSDETRHEIASRMKSAWTR